MEHIPVTVKPVAKNNQHDEDKLPPERYNRILQIFENHKISSDNVCQDLSAETENK